MERSQTRLQRKKPGETEPIKAIETSDSQDTADVKSDLTIEKPVEESQTESNTDGEALTKKSGIMGFLRGKPKSS